MSMKRWKKLILVLVALAVLAAVYGAVLIRRGFSTLDEPSALESSSLVPSGIWPSPPPRAMKTIP